MVKTLKRTILTVIFAFLISTAFCACEKNKDDNPFGGVPDRVISRSSHTESEAIPPDESSPIVSNNPDTEPFVTDTEAQTTDVSVNGSASAQSSDKASQNTTAKTKDDKTPQSPQGSQTSAEEDVSVDETDITPGNDHQDDDNVSVTEQESMAMNYLKLLNSSKVHAVLTEAETMDGVEIYSYEREYYIDGKKAVYINDHQKIIMTSDTVTVIDNEENTYYTYPREDESDSIFGYSPSAYELESAETDEKGSTIEIYTISFGSNTIRSTWVFSPDGKVTVKDESVEFGSFKWYSFKNISKDISGMDMSIPEGLELIEPEDIM